MSPEQSPHHASPPHGSGVQPQAQVRQGSSPAVQQAPPWQWPPGQEAPSQLASAQSVLVSQSLSTPSVQLDSHMVVQHPSKQQTAQPYDGDASPPTQPAPAAQQNVVRPHSDPAAPLDGAHDLS